MPSQNKSIRLAFLALLLVSINPIANAQTSVDASQQVYGPSTVRIEHTTHPLATAANAVGRVENGRQLQRMLLVLTPRAGQDGQLQKLLEAQQNPNSPNYHRWLTPAQFGARFGSADADVQKVRAWLEEAGFTVEAVAASKRRVEFSGTVAQVEAAFQTQMKYYRVGGKAYLANATDLAVPAELAGITRGVVSLNNFGRMPSIHEAAGVAGIDPQGHKVILRANFGGSPAEDSNYIVPGDFAAIYNTKALLNSGIDGSGVSIAVAAQSQIVPTDVQEFRQIFGLKANAPNIQVSGPDPGIESPLDTEETSLAVEWAGAVAPGATIDLVVAGSTDTTSGLDLAAAYAIDNEVAPILVYTYGSCEQALGNSGNAFYNALWQQAAAEGITVLVAAGDNGAAGCDDPNTGVPATQGSAVNGVAATPYNVAVGGTEFAEGANATKYWSSALAADYSSAIGYVPEVAWNESCDPAQPTGATNCAFGNANSSMFAGAGGASTIYAKPSWQSGAGVPADGARDLPDVALAAGSAHDGVVYCTSVAGNSCRTVAQQQLAGLTLAGGTSVAAPAMAGILALVEQKNGAFQGQVNSVLYRLAQTQANRCDASVEMNPASPNSCVFYDVTSGNNAVPCAGGSPGCSSSRNGVNGILQGTVTGPGYDLVTGLGSVNATNLAAAWKAAGSPVAQVSAGSFSLSANSVSFNAGSPGSTTVTITPNAGFTGTVSLTCATGGTSVPAGYNCTFGSANVVVSGNVAATTSLNLSLASNRSASSSVKTALALGNPGAMWGAGVAAAFLLFGLFGMGWSESRTGRNFSLAAGLVLGAISVVCACGGGGGGKGLVSTTTTISSSNLHVGYGTPVTFTVTVTPNGSATVTGDVQLYDNGVPYGSLVPAIGGIASFLATTLPVGVHVFTAQYIGSATTLGSTSAPITQLIAGTVPLQISGTSGGVTETANFNVTLN